MEMQLETASETLPIERNRTREKGKHSYKLLFAAWVILIGMGILGTKLYSDYLQHKISAELSEQSRQQLQQVQEDYGKQIGELKESISGEMDTLEAKVNSLNELLAFTKDSANSKTDSSNQLYSQLSDVKKKLDELQKNLDVLK